MGRVLQRHKELPFRIGPYVVPEGLEVLILS